jgi:hypothetical protein
VEVTTTMAEKLVKTWDTGIANYYTTPSSIPEAYNGLQFVGIGLYDVIGISVTKYEGYDSKKLTRMVRSVNAMIGHTERLCRQVDRFRRLVIG